MTDSIVEKPSQSPASADTVESETAQAAHSPEASPEIATQDIYRPISKSSNSEDPSNANFSLSDKDKTLYVSELDQSVNEADLFKIFSLYGNVLSIRVVKDPVSKESLGYAYVNYNEKEGGMFSSSSNNCPFANCTSSKRSCSRLQIHQEQALSGHAIPKGRQLTKINA